MQLRKLTYPEIEEMSRLRAVGYLLLTEEITDAEADELYETKGELCIKSKLVKAMEAKGLLEGAE